MNAIPRANIIKYKDHSARTPLRERAQRAQSTSTSARSSACTVHLFERARAAALARVSARTPRRMMTQNEQPIVGSHPESSHGDASDVLRLLINSLTQASTDILKAPDGIDGILHTDHLDKVSRTLLDAGAGANAWFAYLLAIESDPAVRDQAAILTSSALKNIAEEVSKVTPHTLSDRTRPTCPLSCLP